EVIAGALGLAPEELRGRLTAINARLLEARLQRAQPGLDDKALVAWNGMMIAAMARCAKSLGDGSLLAPAVAAVEFIWRETRRDGPGGGGGLRGRWRKGRAGPAATLEDSAWRLAGRAGLAGAESSRAAVESPALLQRCEQLYQEAAARFEDAQRPGLFFDAA